MSDEQRELPGPFEEFVADTTVRLDRLERRLTARSEDHRIIYDTGVELVCACGAHLSVYGLTRSTVSVFAQHVASASVTRRATEEAVKRVRTLCDRWDQLSKGPTVTTTEIRAALDGDS